VTGLILSPVVNEFKFDGPFLKLGQNVGLLVGAAFWGIGSDVWGRKCVYWSLSRFLLSEHCYRVSFNITLFILGVFAVSAGGSNNYITLSSLAAVWSIGVGGNLPVDSAIFLGNSDPTFSHRLQTDIIIHLPLDRVHSRVAPIPADCIIHLVGFRPASWQSRTSIYYPFVYIVPS
jgi:hypothetical protein